MDKKDSLPTTTTHQVEDSQIHVSLELDALGPGPLEDDPNVRDLVAHLIESAAVPNDRRLGIRTIVAEGGVAAVWLTDDVALNRKVALKIMHEEACQDPIMVRGFFRESQVTAQMSHPNVVPVHELGVSNGRPFFTMSLVKGKSLQKWLEETAAGDYEKLADFLEIMKKVCDALEYAHSRGVLHCDLKPENIMVGEYGEVYLMDWGAAKLIFRRAPAPAGADEVKDRLPSLPPEVTEGRIFGTPSYMAPEQARGEKPDFRWDIFSLGTIVYKFITGRAPFYSKHPLKAMASCQRCEYDPIEPEKFKNALPMELLRLVQRAMAKNPDDRYDSVAELKNDLAHIMRGGVTFPVIEVKEGAYVIRQGDLDKTAYIVYSGRLEAFQMEGDKKIPLRVLEQGEVFGEMAMFASTSRTASVRALTDVKLLRITEDVLRDELDLMTPWMAAFVRTLAARFAEREAAAASANSGDRVDKDEDIPHWYR